MIRIAGLDSGKQKDQSCLVSIQVNPILKEVFVEACKFWPRRTEYEKIEADIARIHITRQWRSIMVEVNNVGEHVYETLLRRYGLPVRPVTTIAKLSGDRVKKTTAQRLRRSMPKNEMVLLFLKLKKLHKVKFPKTPSKDMQQLITQLTAFSETKTKAGHVSYGGAGSSHDDGVMSLLMALFEAKPLLEQDNQVHVGGPVSHTRASGQVLLEQIREQETGHYV